MRASALEHLRMWEDGKTPWNLPEIDAMLNVLYEEVTQILEDKISGFAFWRCGSWHPEVK